MKTKIAVAVAFAMVASTALAQQPARDAPGNNAINSSGQNNSNAPVAGANSFTEGQAKSRIEQAGFGQVTGLKKDDKGVWRAKAVKNGTSHNVSIDFQGNVNAN
jgi:hypothetical protein